MRLVGWQPLPLQGEAGGYEYGERGKGAESLRPDRRCHAKKSEEMFLEKEVILCSMRRDDSVIKAVKRRHCERSSS